jgi:hypothetical protein
LTDAGASADPAETAVRAVPDERVSMPDIDFDDRRRGEMIRYATEKYGAAWRR